MGTRQCQRLYNDVSMLSPKAFELLVLCECRKGALSLIAAGQAPKSKNKLWLTGGAMVHSQLPEQWFHIFARSQWLPVTMLWLRSKGLCQSWCSVEKASACAQPVFVAIFGTHVDGDVTLAGVVAEGWHGDPTHAEIKPSCRRTFLLLSHSMCLVTTPITSSLLPGSVLFNLYPTWPR